jgi:hypothetical protein
MIEVEGREFRGDLEVIAVPRRATLWDFSEGSPVASADAIHCEVVPVSSGHDRGEGPDVRGDGG